MLLSNIFFIFLVPSFLMCEENVLILTTIGYKSQNNKLRCRGYQLLIYIFKFAFHQYFYLLY